LGRDNLANTFDMSHPNSLATLRRRKLASHDRLARVKPNPSLLMALRITEIGTGHFHLITDDDDDHESHHNRKETVIRPTFCHIDFPSFFPKLSLILLYR
ncbi:hypothetical protein PanWU01x14_323610, partial [Parasponia andersonii]